MTNSVKLRLLLPLICLMLLSNALAGQTANWIWHPEQPQGQVPLGDCYFRKQVEIKDFRQVLLKIAGNDKYEVYLNDKLAAVGESINIKTFDVSSAIRSGENTIAVKVTNSDGNSAGFAAALMIQQHRSKDWRIIATDSTWRTSTKVISIWKKRVFNDSRWKLASILKPGKRNENKAQTNASNDSAADSTPTAGKARPVNVSSKLPAKSENPKSTSEAQETPAKQSLGDEDETSESTKSNPSKNGADAKSVSSSTEKKAEPEIRSEKPEIQNSPSESGSPLPGKKQTESSRQKPASKQVPRSQKNAQSSQPATSPDPKTTNDKSLANRLPSIPQTRENWTSASKDKPMTLAEGFEINKILDGKHGSLIAIAFNEFGQTILSCEGKGLVMVDFTGQETQKSGREITNLVKNVQGILPINGTLFVTGDGPEGSCGLPIIGSGPGRFL